MILEQTEVKFDYIHDDTILTTNAEVSIASEFNYDPKKYFTSTAASNNHHMAVTA